jgi:2-oxoisovalerate dehydrogenase E1 component
VAAEVAAAEAQALAAPRPDPATARDHVTAATGSAAPTPLPADGMTLAYGLAVNRALEAELAARDDVVLFGEDIAIPGGTFGVTRNLRKRFGERVFDTPISEAAILGAAVGAGLEGLRPVVEIMWTDFLFVAFDQVVNQAANVRYLSSGRRSAPLVIRMQQGITPGSCAQHSQSMEALLAHIPGIKVGLPSNAQDAYAMLRAAIADPDPVVMIESRALYQVATTVDLEAPVEPIGGARLARGGSDLVIVTWGTMVPAALAAASQLDARGVSAAVLDLRWLAPLDEDAIARSLAAGSGKALIVHEANVTGGFGAEVAARLAGRHFRGLDAPIVRLGLPDVRVPAAPTLQAALVPGVEQILEAALELNGY